MELLHHDFLLFTDIAGGDAVISRRPDQPYVVTHTDTGAAPTKPSVDWITLDPAPAPILTIAEALERLDVSREPFVFFVDVARGRGSIVYHRYDGHYGLIEPHDESNSIATGMRHTTTP